MTVTPAPMSSMARYKALTSHAKERNTLPYDLLLLLISELRSTSSLASLAKLQRCCKSYYALITPLLYQSVHIHSDDQLQRFLTIEGGRKARKAAKSISLTMTATGQTVTTTTNGRSRAHSVGSVVRGLGLESPKQLEKRKAKEEAQQRQFIQRITASVSAESSPLTSPHTSQLDLPSTQQSSTTSPGLNYTKSEALWLVESLTLDIYPSRASLKLASKLSNSSRAALPRTASFTLTSNAFTPLHDKLARSQAPRIIAEYWASHATALIRPKSVLIDYSPPTLDMRALLEGDAKEGWMDTMWAISAMVQQYGDIDITLRGDIWGAILPAPGARVRVEHTNAPASIITSAPIQLAAPIHLPVLLPAPIAVPTQVIGIPVPLLGAAAAPLLAPAQAAPVVVDPVTPARVQLLKERRQALVLALRSSHVYAEQARSSSPLRWEVVDFFPPRPIFSSAASIRTYDTLAAEEEDRERAEVISALLADLDQQSPGITRKYGKIDERGRRTLSCLKWFETESRGVIA